MLGEVVSLISGAGSVIPVAGKQTALSLTDQAGIIGSCVELYKDRNKTKIALAQIQASLEHELEKIASKSKKECLALDSFSKILHRELDKSDFSPKEKLEFSKMMIDAMLKVVEL